MVHIPLKVAFGDPEYGWINFTLDFGGEVITEGISYVHSSFHELVDALLVLLQLDAEKTVTMNTEPWNIEFCFTRKADKVTLEIRQYPDHRRSVFVPGKQLLFVSGTYDDVCLPFWRALRSLQGRFSAQEWQSRWRQPFPSVEMNHLTERINARKRPRVLLL